MSLLDIIAPHKVVFPAHDIDPQHNARFSVKRKTKRFFTAEQKEKYLSNLEEMSKNNVFVQNSSAGFALYGIKVQHAKFLKGYSSGNTTYALFTNFGGDVVAGEPYPQQYTVTITDKELKNKFTTDTI